MDNYELGNSLFLSFPCVYFPFIDNARFNNDVLKAIKLITIQKTN